MRFVVRTGLLLVLGACAHGTSAGTALPASTAGAERSAPGSSGGSGVRAAPTAVTGDTRHSTAAAMRRSEPRRQLQQFIDSLVDDPEFRSASWGVLIVDPGKGETLYSRNADKLFMPASNMKLLTGSTALVQLGGEYRWTTTVLGRGGLRDGILGGDLVVRGSGDPSASAHMQKGDALAPLRALADTLRAHGVTRVHGRLVAAPSPFTDAPLGYGWSWSDLDDSYSAGVDALYFNEGFTEVVVHGGARAGDPVRASTRPATSFPALIDRARTVAPLSKMSTTADSLLLRTGIRASQDSSHAGVLVSGAIAAGDSVVIELSFRDQQAAYLLALREALTARGITVDDARSDTTAHLDSIATLWSPPLREVMPYFEKPSQNQIGELLLKTLAVVKTGVGRADSGAAVVSRQLLAWGAEQDGFAVHDGSGLSRHDYVTPRTIVRVLSAMRTQPDFRIFYDALPIAGVDGTIRNRMKDTPAQGNVHGKTGTLDKARSLSGYVTTTDGQMLLFSALCNNYVVSTRRVDRVSDAVAVRLASMRLDP